VIDSFTRVSILPYKYCLQNGDGVADTAAHSGYTANQPEDEYCWIGQGLE